MLHKILQAVLKDSEIYFRIPHMAFQRRNYTNTATSVLEQTGHISR